ncbi:hypothetical protein ACGFYV_36000 [Streptomyces sp. NPDC048297]|uniref:hypothetical protein n=1 Tax=Streptomyces sp. NPDC048297 TaxID=3365531 RepID=UPI0037104159
MRSLYVPVRLAVTVLAVATAAGCVNVGDDAGRVRPGHSAGQRGDDAPDGGPAAGGGAQGYGEKPVDGKHGRDHKAKPGESAPASASPSGADSVSPVPPKPGGPTAPGDPPPTKLPPTPPETSAPPEPPASSPPPPVSDPPSAEPSSSAHEDPGPQLVDREPAPAAGVAA